MGMYGIVALLRRLYQSEVMDGYDVKLTSYLILRTRVYNTLVGEGIQRCFERLRDVVIMS